MKFKELREWADRVVHRMDYFSPETTIAIGARGLLGVAFPCAVEEPELVWELSTGVRHQSILAFNYYMTAEEARGVANRLHELADELEESNV